MTFIRRLLYFVILLLALGCMLILGLLGQNQEQVALKLIDYETPAFSVFWWILAAFGAGLVLGLLLLFISNTKHVFDRRKLSKDLSKRDQRIAELTDEVDQLKVERLGQLSTPREDAS